MACAERIDRRHPMAESFSEAKSTLDEVFRFYKWRRHAQGFPEEVYLLLSRCTYACFSLWRSAQESEEDFFRRSPPPAAFWMGLDFSTLRGNGPGESVLGTDGGANHFTNDTKWFEFWIRILEQSDPRGAAVYREFARQILACMGHEDLLEGKMGSRTRKTLDLLVKKDEAGRVLLHTISVLEDVVQAILRYFATLDGRTCVLEKTGLLMGLLSEMRQIIVWETPAKGPYSPSSDARWRGRSPLTWLSRDRSPGVLTVIPRREGGQIICIYSPASEAKGRRCSWVRQVTSLRGTYEEALFATWSYETGEHRKNPQQFPGATACWTVQYAEAQRLEALSRQGDLLLASLQGNPKCQRMAEAVRRILRNGSPRWKSVALPWTYVRQMDQLLEKLISAYREASTLGADDAAERVVAQNWASEETIPGGVGSSCPSNCPSGEVSPGAASRDMTFALGEVKYVLPKANSGALDESQPSCGSSEPFSPGPVGGQDSCTVPQPETDEGMTAEESPEKPEPSEQSPGVKVETTAGKPPEEPELAESSPGTMLETARENLPEEPELSEQSPEAEAETTAGEPPDEPEPSEPRPEATLETAREEPLEKAELSEQGPDATIEMAAEKPPEKPELSEYSPAAEAETTVEELLNEPEPSEPHPQGTMETALENPPEEPELSSEDSGTDGPVPVHEENPTAAAPGATGGQEQPLPAEVANLMQPTETDAAQAVVATSPEEPVRKPARRKKTTNESRHGDMAGALLVRLLEHHVGPKGRINYTPLSIKQLQQDLDWNQSQVQRAMTSVFGPKPVRVYGRKCKDRSIPAFLRAHVPCVHQSAKQGASV
jgi:hypothetical protein